MLVAHLLLQIKPEPKGRSVHVSVYVCVREGREREREVVRSLIFFFLAWFHLPIVFIWICLDYSLVIFSHIFETVEFLNLECLLVSFKHSW